MTASKILAWVAVAVLLLAVAGLGFTIVKLTLADPAIDPVREAADFFFGPALWAVLVAAAAFVASLVAKRFE